ncbi:MAG TPA: hypothetical protein DEP72_06965 [Clostridiales bacterium]|nr:MAG: hypothetical protein A2Y18_07930 [Clostridiales bacterium GWD2_32_19]HCC07881.1 hypothetical protein [Clostridiales bacterium]
MILEFNEEETEILVKMAFISDMVIDGIRSDEDTRGEIDKVIHKIYEGAFKSGMNKEIGHYVDENTYDLENGYSEKIYDEYIEKYDERVFWEELPFRLAERDIEGSDKTYKTREEYMKAVWDKQEVYEEEIENNGLDRFIIDTSKESKPSSNGSCGCGCGHDH